MNPETNGQGEALPPNDDARPQPGAEAQPPATAPAAAPAASDPPAAPTIDPDDAELAAARAAVEAESAAGQGGGQQPGAQPGTQAAPTTDSTPGGAAAPGQGEGAKPPAMVPHSVFHKERAARQAAEREAIFLAGQVEALKATGGGTPPATTSGTPAAPAAAPSPAADPIQAEIDARNAEIYAAADRFDTGEISMAEFKRAEAAAQARIVELQAQRILATTMPAAPAQSIADEAIFAAHLTKLADTHPYSGFLTEQQAQVLAQRAMMDAAMEGRSFGTGPAADMALQAAVARLSDEWGPKWGITLPPEVAARRNSGGTQQQSKPGQPGMSASAAATQRKIDMAAALPPDTSAMGNGGTGGLDLSEASIMAMDEEQIAALPAAARARIFKLAG